MRVLVSWVIATLHILLQPTLIIIYCILMEIRILTNTITFNLFGIYTPFMLMRNLGGDQFSSMVVREHLFVTSSKSTICTAAE